MSRQHLRRNKKISVFRVKSLKVLGRAHIFFLFFFLEKYIILGILKGNGKMPFKMHKIIYFSTNSEKKF